MSILLSAVHRRDFNSARAQERMQAILEAIAPEPVRHAANCEVRRAGRHVQGTLNLPGHYPRRDLSLCQGKLYDSEDSWWRTGSGVPDGSFAIIRDGAEAFEAVSDPAGSRMLWTYKDDGLFVVSNSERAATMYAGRFELNRDVVPWMVSTGTRGLFASYNRHLRQLPPAAVARLDKRILAPRGHGRGDSLRGGRPQRCRASRGARRRARGHLRKLPRAGRPPCGDLALGRGG